MWITPFYRSPQRDHGYDVADYCDVDPLFGTLDDADALLARAHELGLRVIVDLVPNHTSSEHPWFQEALAAEPGSDARARYLFRTGRGRRRASRPTTGSSVFGGPAWTRVGDTDQWYLHLFDPTQPDLDWRNPDVARLFDDVLRFWLDRGVDGFRVDVAHGLVKEDGLRDQVVTAAEQAAAEDADAMVDAAAPSTSRCGTSPGCTRSTARWHRILDEYDGDRMAVAEAWTRTAEAMARYVRDDELHQAFNFHWLLADWSAAELGRVIEETLAALAEVGGEPTWVLSNHDVSRHPTRYGGGRGRPGPRPRRDAGVAGAARLGVPLPGRGARPGGRRRRPGAPAGPVLVPDRQARAGRLPGADPVGGRPAAVRLRAGQRSAVDPAAGRLGGRSRSPPSRPTRTRRWRSTGRRWPPGASTLPTPATRSWSRSTADALTLRRGELTVVLNCGATPVPMPPGELLIASGRGRRQRPAGHGGVGQESLSDAL